MTKIDRLVTIWMMVATGLVMVIYAITISNALYPPIAQPSGDYIIRDTEIMHSIFVCRCLGIMIFAAGLVERLALAINGLLINDPINSEPTLKARSAWSVPD